MSKVAVVYWSGTGNTEAMAEAVLEGVKEAGGEGVMMMCTDFDVSMMDSFDAIAFGCPSMGAVICNDAPDDEAKSDCRALGKALV